MDKEKKSENQKLYEVIDENIVKLAKAIELYSDGHHDSCNNNFDSNDEYNGACEECKLQPLCEYRGAENVNLALYLIDEGYGNVKQAVKEFAEELKEYFNKIGYFQGYPAPALCYETDELIRKRFGKDKE